MQRDETLQRRVRLILAFQTLGIGALGFMTIGGLNTFSTEHSIRNIVFLSLMVVIYIAIWRGHVEVGAHMTAALATLHMCLNFRNSGLRLPFFRDSLFLIPFITIFYASPQFAFLCISIVMWVGVDLLDGKFFFEQDTMFKPWSMLDTTAAITFWVTILLGTGISRAFSVGERKALKKRTETLAELQDELEIRKQAEERALAASKAKGDFLAVMSHEIRTPLHGILGITQVLQRAPLREEEAESIETIQSCGQSLLVILNDLLDISKIESGSLSLESIPFDLWATARRISQLQKPNIAAKNLRFEFHLDEVVPQWVNGDPTRIGQVLLNLLSNATKFTEKGAIVVYIQLRGKNIYFAVSDTGIGISEEAQVRLFQPFEQAESSTSRRFGGTGLGLSISRQLVELMGGQLEVTSKLGEGSLFWFEIPLSEAKSPTESVVDSDHSDLQPPKLTLVVDDNEINRTVAQKLLESHGFPVLCAESGTDALIYLGQHMNIDFVLMDVCMPAMDGCETTQRIRSMEAFSHIPIIGLTCNSSSEEYHRALNAGMNECISKPYRIGDILDAWQRLQPSASKVEHRIETT